MPKRKRQDGKPLHALWFSTKGISIPRGGGGDIKRDGQGNWLLLGGGEGFCENAQKAEVATADKFVFPIKEGKLPIVLPFPLDY